MEPIYFTEHMDDDGEPVDPKAREWSAYLHVQRTAEQIIAHAKRQKEEDERREKAEEIIGYDPETAFDACNFIKTDGNVVMVEVRNYHVHRKDVSE